MVCYHGGAVSRLGRAFVLSPCYSQFISLCPALRFFLTYSRSPGLYLASFFGNVLAIWRFLAIGLAPATFQGPITTLIAMSSSAPRIAYSAKNSVV